MTTSSLDLENEMKGVKDFHGVYARDKLPNKLMKGSYIFNLDTTKGHTDKEGNKVLGSHWVAVCVFPDNTLMYYDSYGLSAPQNLINAWKKQYKKLYYNTSINQKFTEEHCGPYCVMFCKKSTKGINEIDKWIKSKEYISYV